MLMALEAPRGRKNKSLLSSNVQRQRTYRVTSQSNLAESVTAH